MNSLMKEKAMKPHKLHPYQDTLNISGLAMDLYANISTNTTDNSSQHLPLWATYLFAVFLSLVILATIIGNLLVLVTIRNNRRLQTNTNCFIFSLSLSDLLLGVFVLPFSAVNTLTGEWVLGAHFCNTFTALDVTLCTVSIVQLIVISFDRFLAVMFPFHHIRWVNRRRVYYVIGFIWAVSALIGFVPIFAGWNTLTGKVQNHAAPHICAFENTNRQFVLSIGFGTFFIPLVLMYIAYSCIYVVTIQQVKRINEMTKYGTVSNGNVQHHPPPASDSKATRTLFFVMALFTLCWFPYFTIFTMKGFHYEINVLADLICLWLGYINSTFNPVLYAFTNTEFRYGFMWVLCRERAIRYREKNPDVVHLWSW